MKTGVESKRNINKVKLDNGVEIKTTVTRTVNKAPGKKPCAMRIYGCNGTAADGEWLCPKCLKNFDRYQTALCVAIQKQGLTIDEFCAGVEDFV